MYQPLENDGHKPSLFVKKVLYIVDWCAECFELSKDITYPASFSVIETGTIEPSDTMCSHRFSPSESWKKTDDIRKKLLHLT